MIRMLLAGIAALLVCAGSARAEEVKGTLKSFNKDKNLITVAIDGKDKEFKVNDKTKFLRGNQESPNALETLGKILERVKEKGIAVKLDVDGETVKSISLALNSAIQPGAVPGQPVKPIQVRPLPAPIQPVPNAPAVKPVQL